MPKFLLSAALLVLPVALVLPWPSTSGVHAKQPTAAGSITLSIPKLVRLDIAFVPVSGLPPEPSETATLAIYGSATDDAPLWQETQSLSLNRERRYTALLGATKPEGIPADLFTSHESRWIGVRFHRPGEVELPRQLMTRVP